ncbi:hypothetical protein ACT26D_06285 [Megasphaera elsdenii]|uniref:hypothetical protein n=1 Tax=Megasphaera elsdenii TaxID=907 RepID=UPI0040366C9D
MKCVKVAVISKKNEREDDIHLRMLDLTHLVHNDALYTKIRAITPDVEERTTVIGDMEERTVILVDGKLVPDRFSVEEEAEQLSGLDAVLDQDNQFFTEKEACQKALEARDRRDWLYVFECYR